MSHEKSGVNPAQFVVIVDIDNTNDTVHHEEMEVVHKECLAAVVKNDLSLHPFR